jgi:DNA-binding Lrp family transcriptional regulator
MKLTDKEADVLAAVELRADKPIEEIRKETGLRDHTIRYHLKSIEDRGIARPLPFINVYALGYVQYNIFFSVGVQNRKTREDLLKVLVASRSVTWVGEMGADVPFGIGICTRQMHDMHNLLLALSRRFPNVFFEKFVSAQFSCTIFPRKYLSSRKPKVPMLTLGRTTELQQVDELDDRILSGLSLVPHRSRRELAMKVKIPLSTLELRIKKLEQRGVIPGYYYAVDSAKFGILGFKLLVYARGINPDLTAQLLRFCAAHHAVIYLIECFGNWDYEIGVEVKRPEDVIEVTQELYEQCGVSINSVRVLSKFRDLKNINYPSPLPATATA